MQVLLNLNNDKNQNDDNFIHIKTNAKVSQYTLKKQDYNASCTYNAISAINYFNENKERIKEIYNKIDKNKKQIEDEGIFFNKIWKDILNDGSNLYIKNSNYRANPHELIDFYKKNKKFDYDFINSQSKYFHYLIRHDNNNLKTQLDDEIDTDNYEYKEIDDYFSKLNETPYFLTVFSGETYLFYKVNNNNYIFF